MMNEDQELDVWIDEVMEEEFKEWPHTPEEGRDMIQRRIDYYKEHIAIGLANAQTAESQEACDVILNAVAESKRNLAAAEQRLAAYEMQLKGKN